MYILYVEDREEEQELIANALRKHHHEVTIINNVFDALLHLRTNEPDILLCDYLLGDGPNGLFVAETARNLFADCTIVMISSALDLDKAISAMQIGADDFVGRPITLEHLEERLWKAVSRHQSRQGVRRTKQQTQSAGPVAFNSERSTISWNEKPALLTPTEFAIASLLFSQAGNFVAFSDLWNSVRGEWLSASDARDLLKPHISNLREKLKNIDAAENVIENVRGKGYLWNRD